MSIIFKATKYKILEWSIDSLFNHFERNFKMYTKTFSIRDIKVGMKFKEIVKDIRNTPDYYKYTKTQKLSIIVKSWS